MSDRVLGTRTPLELMHIGAHAAYPILLPLAADTAKRPSIKKYLKDFLDVYIERINEMGTLIVGGETIEKLKDRVIDMHRTP